MAVLGLPLLVKALSTALIVVLASVLAEAAGPFWGALVASLPVSPGRPTSSWRCSTTAISLRRAR